MADPLNSDRHQRPGCFLTLLPFALALLLAWAV